MLRKLLFVLLCVHAGFSAACSRGGSNAESGSPADKALALLEQQDYQALEQLVQPYREGLQFRKDGSGEIFSIYSKLSASGSCKGEPPPSEVTAARKRQLDNWAQSRPASPLPRTALGKYYVERAWDARGTGWGNTLSDAQVRSLHEYMTLAERTLEKVPTPERDAQWYVSMLNVSLVEHFPEQRHLAIFNEGAARFPTYYELYRPAGQYFQAKWHGSEDAYLHFADTASAISKDLTGDAMYARLHAWGDRKDMYKDGRTSWPRMKAGLIRQATAYPTRFNHNRYAFQACRADDREATRQAFTLVAGDTDVPEIWRGYEDLLVYCQAYQHGPVQCGRALSGKYLCVNSGPSNPQ